MDITGIGEAATAAQKILGMFFPDKTEEDRAKMAAALAVLQSQTDIDKAEAQSGDPLQHWRGALGWVCACGYAYNFVLQPLIVNIADIAGRPLGLHPLEIGPLVTLTLGMLGLGGLHVAERVKGAA